MVNPHKIICSNWKGGTLTSLNSSRIHHLDHHHSLRNAVKKLGSHRNLILSLFGMRKTCIDKSRLNGMKCFRKIHLPRYRPFCPWNPWFLWQNDTKQRLILQEGEQNFVIFPNTTRNCLSDSITLAGNYLGSAIVWIIA